MNKPVFKPGDIVLVNLPEDNIYFTSLYGYRAQLIRRLHYSEGPRWVFRMLEGPFNNVHTYRAAEAYLSPYHIYPSLLKEGGLPKL